MSNRSGFGSFFAGFLAGSVIGAIATVLYAPKSGEETRDAIKGKTDEFIGKANISVDDAYKQAETAAREARDRFENLATATRKRAEDITRRGQVILEEQISNFKKTGETAAEPEQEEILMQKEAPEEIPAEPADETAVEPEGEKAAAEPENSEAPEFPESPEMNEAE